MQIFQPFHVSWDTTSKAPKDAVPGVFGKHVLMGSGRCRFPEVCEMNQNKSIVNGCSSSQTYRLEVPIDVTHQRKATTSNAAMLHSHSANTECGAHHGISSVSLYVT